MNCESAPCPREQLVPEGSPSAVGDGESLLRVIVREEWLNLAPDGTVVPSTAAFSQQELQRKHGKSVSVIRSITTEADTARHAKRVNKQPEWRTDPVIALAPVGAVRGIKSDERSREACVLADPDNDSDPPFLTHASIVRACPLPAENDRLSWHALRLELVSQFEDVRHLSGKAVNLAMGPGNS
jgi:hypothetical protein